MKKRCLSWVLVFAVLGMIPLSRALANDVVEYEVTNYWQKQSFGHVYRIDFTTCTVSEPAGVGTPQALVKQSFSICNKDSRVRFSVTHANGYVIDYDWILEDGGRTVKGAYKDSNVGWGPSIGRARQTLSPPATVSLAGKWEGYRDGRKVADCSIQQQGTALTFIIHRTPEERSSGRLISATQLEATDWKEQGTISPDGRRITWRNSYWAKVDSPPPPAVSLAGKWAGYRDGRKVADCSIQQQGTNLTLIIHRTPEERSRGRLISATQLEAIDWKEYGSISPDGRRINWGHAYWSKVD